MQLMGKKRSRYLQEPAPGKDKEAAVRKERGHLLVVSEDIGLAHVPKTVTLSP